MEHPHGNVPGELSPDAERPYAPGRFLSPGGRDASGDRGVGGHSVSGDLRSGPAHLWLGNFSQAATLAAEVPRDFVYTAEYSQNDPVQFNEMYMFTWGDIQSIRWTIGDGTATTRGNERWEHFDEFQALNLLQNEPSGFASSPRPIPVGLQLLYNRADSEVLVASGAEAMLIRAEVAVRNGQTEDGQAAAQRPALRLQPPGHDSLERGTPGSRKRAPDAHPHGGFHGRPQDSS